MAFHQKNQEHPKRLAVKPASLNRFVIMIF